MRCRHFTLQVESYIGQGFSRYGQCPGRSYGKQVYPAMIDGGTKSYFGGANIPLVASWESPDEKKQVPALVLARWY